MKHALEGGVAMAEPLMEEEEDWRKSSSSAGGLAPQVGTRDQSEGMHLWGLGFGSLGQGIHVARRGPPTSAKAWGKAPAVELPPLQMGKELAWWLEQEEVAAEEAWLGQDIATLEVVREAAGLLMRGQLEGLGGPS